MEIERIEGHTRVLALDQRQYRPLHIRDQVEEGVNYMTSQWRPTPEDIAKIVMGAPLLLSVGGTGHPPVLIQVGAVPASAGVMDVDGGTAPSQELYRWRVWDLNRAYKQPVHVQAPNRQAAINEVAVLWHCSIDDLDAERP